MALGDRNKLLIMSIVLMVAAISSVAAFAQASEPTQIAANTTPPTVSKAAGELSPSTAVLQARIDAQQQEINRLSALVEQLQASLQPVASTHPVLPSSLTGFLPSYGAEPGSPAAPAAPEPLVATNSTPRELLPDIGHIGAELGFFVGGATNPYKDNNGFATGGYIDLPWKNVPGGKLSYEIMIGLQRAVTTQQTTSGVNVLVNASLNSFLGNQAMGLPFFLGVAPSTGGTQPLLPDTTTVQERSKVLTVAPFELKYAITKLGRFRPYAVAGLGAYVWIGSDNNTAAFNAVTSLNNYAPGLGNTYGALVNSLLQGSQIGGLVPTAPQLASRGVPHGQGNLLFGGQVGGGFEFRVTPKLSLGADFRRNQVEGAFASFNTFTFKQGLHW